VAVLVDDSRSMGIAEAGGTREAAARRALDGHTNRSLTLPGAAVQVRQRAAARRGRRTRSTLSEPATRIGDTLERVMAESSSLPLGAIVLLTTERTMRAAGSSGYAGRPPQAAHPGSHHRVRPRASGPRRGDHRRRAAGAGVAAITVDRDRHVFQFGFSGSRARLSRARQREGAGASQDATLASDGGCGPNRWCSIVATRGSKTFLDRASTRCPAKRTCATTQSLAWSTWRRASAHPIRGRRAALGLQNSSAAPLPFLPNDDHPEQEIASMLRTTQNKGLPAGHPPVAKNWKTDSRPKRGTVRVSGPDHWQRGA